MFRSTCVPVPAALRLLLAAIAACTLLAGCAAPGDAPSAAQRLRTLIAAGDLPSADALIASNPAELDPRRALDLAIRGGHVAAVRHFVAATGPDVPLDPDGSTPLIRAVLDAPGPSRSELVALLIAAGADPLQADRYGRDPIDYATVRNRGELIALMGVSRVSAGTPVARREPTFADWLGAGSLTADAGRDRPVASARRTPEPGGPAAVPDAQPPSASLLLRRSPWRPAAPPGPGTERAALRFHADGALDVLRQRPGVVDVASLPDAYGAWRLDAGGELRLAIVGPAFDVACLGRIDAGSASAAPGRVDAGRASAAPGRGDAGRASAAPGRGDAGRALEVPGRVDAERAPTTPGRLELSCEAVPPPAAGAARSLDLARAMLDRAGTMPSTSPSMLAIASGRVPLPGDARTDDASHAESAPARAAVSLAGSAPLAACRPSRSRPQAPQPSARVLGDWHSLDIQRFESRAPTSGALCPQTVARDAAMAACRTGAGRDAAVCRSVGGCPAGQVSVVAGLPGVDAGWVGCAADPALARRHALDACRADLGCDCQVAAFSGRNLLPVSGGATCPAPKR
ncbi:MAG: hypothetical protein RJA99_4199 [Pseudomonadota bacterium]